jgi:hypothetical protein
MCLIFGIVRLWGSDTMEYCSGSIYKMSHGRREERGFIFTFGEVVETCI